MFLVQTAPAAGVATVSVSGESVVNAGLLPLAMEPPVPFTAVTLMMQDADAAPAVTVAVLAPAPVLATST
jgi:hypothetical protein